MNNQKQILSLEELKQYRKPIRNINIEHQGRLTRLEKFALWITRRIGSVGFFLALMAWTTIWLLWNTFGPAELRFDPLPAFALWLLFSNMIQLFLLPLIMVGQNLQGRHAEARVEADFEINVRAECEIEAILLRLEHQNNLISEILQELRDKKEK